MTQQTPLHATHVAAGARMVDFAGWDMPVNYGSQIEEHHAVRRDAGMFDVSHMLALDLEGADAKAFLRGLIANDVAKLVEPGKALYACMLNEQGGVIDDLIVYFLSDAAYRIVVNAGTADKDVAWMQQRLAATGAAATLSVRRDLAMIAVQGPNARAKTWAAIPGSEAASSSLKPFQAAACGEFFIARTGYTGEDGFEVMVKAASGPDLWDALMTAGSGHGLVPAGLGARDTLRLEAKMCLYGNELDETTTLIEAGLGWITCVDSHKGDFNGRAVLAEQKSRGTARKLVGFEMKERGIARHGYPVLVGGSKVSVVTSGSMAPFLEKNIGLAYVPSEHSAIGTTLGIEIRGVSVAAEIVKTPFYKRAK